ncbi:uncharacterized protein LOC131303015 [Rhododendron vialii]|uniref:uncharacterized protein LOC131303015 n=1 Tax=Rhododendron vialii TaxID=182163 RepID=UPI00265DC38E|nr:uncharacterized protein LOC131303015 [Rhododendron vialii]
MNEFCKRRPPTCHGDTNPVVAETWLNDVKMILRTLRITQNGDRVALTTYQLKGEAHYWWDLMEGTMTVTQYAAKFEELSRYTQTAVATKDKKARRFDWGLTTARRAVVAQAFPTYTSVVKCALRMKSEENDFKTRWRKAAVYGQLQPPMAATSEGGECELWKSETQQPGQTDFMRQTPRGPS